MYDTYIHITYIHCEVITTIRLTNISVTSCSYFLCVWRKHLRFTFLADFKDTVPYY